MIQDPCLKGGRNCGPNWDEDIRGAGRGQSREGRRGSLFLGYFYRARAPGESCQDLYQSGRRFLQNVRRAHTEFAG
jgi:hypothetical protein